MPTRSNRCARQCSNGLSPSSLRVRPTRHLVRVVVTPLSVQDVIRWAKHRDRFAANLIPLLQPIRVSGPTTLASVAQALNYRGIRADIVASGVS